VSGFRRSSRNSVSWREAVARTDELTDGASRQGVAEIIAG
jgi:hypothetical protein